LIPIAPVDWYGIAEVSVNLGALFRSRQDERYVNARMHELETAPYEVEARVREFRDEMRAAVEQARRELGVVEHGIAILDSTRAVLEKSEASDLAHARDALAVEQLAAESEAVFLRTLIEALSKGAETDDVR
jgi:hypothetical protein